MANLVYERVSTDQQSTDRQNLVLAEAGIEDPVPFEGEPGTSSRLHPLQRPKFGELLTYARPGDTVHISEMFRLVRGTGHILDVLDVLHRDQVALRIHDGAFSAMDLTARHPRTGELLSTVKFMVQTLAAAGELQRDLPEHAANEEDVPAPELPVTLDMPGKVADFLRAADLEPAERAALDHGVTVRRGQGPHPVTLIVDSQSVKGASTVGRNSRGYDAAKKINGRKRHITVDTLGLPVMITVTPADIQDRDAARDVFWRPRLTQPQITQVWADRGYAGDLVDWARERLWLSLRIVSRPKGTKGFVVLPRRWKVERTIGWCMNARRNARDYERLPQHSEAHMNWALITLMTRRLTRKKPVPGTAKKQTPAG